MYGLDTRAEADAVAARLLSDVDLEDPKRLNAAVARTVKDSQPGRYVLARRRLAVSVALVRLVRALAEADRIDPSDAEALRTAVLRAIDLCVAGRLLEGPES